MKNKLQPVTRIFALLSTIGLVAVLFLPLWRIELTAPQYPEGLALIIRPNGLAGDVEVINGLNHYIGMRTLHSQDFIEFAVLPYIIGILAFFGLLTVLINRRWFFNTWSILFIMFGIIAMIDFYRWEYNYGHNLDPTAPIQVPGMAYQPPLIGFKQLLNFGAYSIPAAGGWIFLTVGLGLAVGLWLENRKLLLRQGMHKVKSGALAACLMIVLSSCDAQPVPLKMGTDACFFCKMTLTDPRFGGEIITNKGRIIIFDDTHCMKAFMKAGNAGDNEYKSIWISNYSAPGVLLDVQKAFLLKSNELRSPMGGNVAAFATKEQLERVQQTEGGTVQQWKDL